VSIGFETFSFKLMLGSAPLHFTMHIWALLLVPFIFIATCGAAGAQSMQQKALFSLFVK
jgi:hypothetical protein